MMKKLVAVAVLSAVPFTAFADNDAGCGVGTQIWKGQKGLLPKVLAATTNGTFYNTISMTFGVLGCSSDGVVTASARMPMYAGANLDQLAAEMAAGEGETLANLASLYGIEAEDRAAFYALTQANFASIFASEDVTAGDVLHNVSLVLAADQRLARYLA
jgi:hypothetical protein